MKYLLIAAYLCVCASTITFAQQRSTSLWDDVNTTQINARASEPWMRSMILNEPELTKLLTFKAGDKREARTIELPYPDGSLKTFTFTQTALMHADLAEKYPGIKTFKGVSADGKSRVRFDYTPKGFHAIIFDVNGTIYIDPNDHNSRQYYNSYTRADYKNNREKIFIEDEIVDSDKKPFEPQKIAEASRQFTTSGTELRKYRIAIAASGEYTAFHGGTVEAGLAAIVTTLNRVTGIYEDEVAVTFELVANNDLIVYTDAATDPYDNGDASGAINANQTNLDKEIGTENYDIGHIFSTGSGGLAGLGVVCNETNKARGTTGTNSPTGDPFDVDFVAHEIGHQFAGPHTFNGSSGNCSGGNRSGGNAYEPGSGTTIMAYAGICAPQNVQNNSDPYFHVASLESIVTFTTLAGGNDCAETTSTGNTPPEVTISSGSHTIPINTPFKLNGSATDIDGDNLTYSWEQYDLGPTGHPNEPTGQAALFRAFPPAEVGERVFPQISDILGQTQTLGEILPSYARELNFQLIVRDNNVNGGGFNTADLQLEVSDAAGPFLVTSQAETDLSYPVGSVQAVLWDVAGTAGATVNCQNVKITLSIDGGQTFSEVLVESTANDGAENITIPDNPTTTARIRVEAVDNVFFNINNNDFAITAVTEPDFYLTVEPAQQTVCAPENGTYIVSAGGLLDFNDDIALSLSNTSSELSYDFSATTIKPGEQSTLTVSGTGSATTESNPFTIDAISGSLNHNINVGVNVLPQLSAAPVLISPSDNASEVPSFTVFSWEPLDGAKKYNFDLATDADFNNIIQSRVDLVQTETAVAETLDDGTTYFWRVLGINDCGESQIASSNFKTLIKDCSESSAIDIPIDITFVPNEVISTIEVTEDFEIADVNIYGLDITHTWVSDLTISLISPGGTEVNLMVGECGDSDNILLNFDSQSPNATISCPATDGGTYRPANSLGQFNGEPSLGTWQLKVNDGFNEDGGSLNSWTLELCTIPIDIVLTAETIAHDQIDLAWDYDNSGNETGFEIEVSDDFGLNFSSLTTLDAGSSSYSHTGLDASTRYDYKIRSILSDGPGNYSKSVSGTTLLSPSDAPTDLIASISSSNTRNVELTWTDNSESEEGFIVERKQNDETDWTEITTATGTNYRDEGIEFGTTSTYRVLAFNAGGNSLPSNEVSIVVTSLRDEIVRDIKLYPNPGSETLNISFGEHVLQLESIEVISISGKIMIEEEFKSKNIKNVDLNLANLSKGIYLISMKTTDGVVVKKWMKN